MHSKIYAPRKAKRLIIWDEGSTLRRRSLSYVGVIAFMYNEKSTKVNWLKCSTDRLKLPNIDPCNQHSPT